MVAEVGTVITKHGYILPFQNKLHICSMRLLLDALVYTLLCVTNLQPSIVACYLRSAISIHHPDERVETLYLGCVHHAISFTLVRMKFRSCSSKPYLSNNCSSISAMLLFQSISEEDVKS